MEQPTLKVRGLYLNGQEIDPASIKILIDKGDKYVLKETSLKEFFQNIETIPPQQAEDEYERGWNTAIEKAIWKLENLKKY